jgi:hypothetical protein
MRTLLLAVLLCLPAGAQTAQDANLTTFQHNTAKLEAAAKPLSAPDLVYAICECGWRQMNFVQRARYWWHDPCKAEARAVAKRTGLSMSVLGGK